MTANIEGKVAIVTGAANGVGRAVARLFAEQGARMVLADIQEDTLDERADAVREEGAEVVRFACDLREKLSVANLLAAAIDAYDRVDILVNASREVAAGDALTSDAVDLTALFDANVRAPYLLSQAVARRMIQQREEVGGAAASAGAIVNIGSIAGRRTLPQLLHYSVTCAALDQLTRSLAVALAPSGVRVNAVALGGVMTSSLQDALRDHDDLRRELTAVTPLGRIGEAEEAAEAALFLASDSASFVTGQILAVDGGRTMLDPLATPLV